VGQAWRWKRPPDPGEAALRRGAAWKLLNDTVLSAYSKPNPNLAKSGQARPSPAKENQRKSLGFPFVRIEPFQWVIVTPQGKKSFAPLSSHWSVASSRALVSEHPRRVSRFPILTKENACENAAAGMTGRFFMIPEPLKAIPPRPPRIDPDFKCGRAAVTAGNYRPPPDDWVVGFSVGRQWTFVSRAFWITYRRFRSPRCERSLPFQAHPPLIQAHAHIYKASG
jgi:hypothetical protein